MSEKGSRTALITGATSGIGEALAYLLASQGFHLILSGRDPHRLQALSKNLTQAKSVLTVAADLSLEGQKHALIQVICQHTPDLVINNAGFGIYGDAISCAIEDELNMIAVNASALLELTLEAAKAMHKIGQKGTILNVASAAAFFAFPGAAVYAASKSFVVNVSKALDREFQPYGIRILTACPGMVDTQFSNRAGGRANPQKPLAMTAPYAAEQIWRQIQCGKRLYIFDWKTRWAVRLSKFFPETWVANILYRSIQSRLK